MRLRPTDSLHRANFDLVCSERSFVRQLRFVSEVRFRLFILRGPNLKCVSLQTVLPCTAQVLKENILDTDEFESLCQIFRDMVHYHSRIVENMYDIQLEYYPKFVDLVSRSSIMDVPWRFLYEQRYVPSIRAVVQELQNNPDVLKISNKILQVFACSRHQTAF